MGPFVTLHRVKLPLILPRIVLGWILAFIVSFDEVAMTVFLVAPGTETVAATDAQPHPGYHRSLGRSDVGYPDRRHGDRSDTVQPLLWTGPIVGRPPVAQLG